MHSIRKEREREKYQHIYRSGGDGDGYNITCVRYVGLVDLACSDNSSSSGYVDDESNTVRLNNYML